MQRPSAAITAGNCQKHVESGTGRSGGLAYSLFGYWGCWQTTGQRFGSRGWITRTVEAHHQETHRNRKGPAQTHLGSPDSVREDMVSRVGSRDQQSGEAVIDARLRKTRDYREMTLSAARREPAIVGSVVEGSGGCPTPSRWGGSIGRGSRRSRGEAVGANTVAGVTPFHGGVPFLVQAAGWRARYVSVGCQGSISKRAVKSRKG